MSPSVFIPLVPIAISQSANASFIVSNRLRFSRTGLPDFDLAYPSSFISQPLTSAKSSIPKLAITRATAPTLPGCCGSTMTILNNC